MDSGEINLLTEMEYPVPVYLSISSLQAEESPNAWCLVVTDLTEQKRNEEIIAEGRLAQLVIEQAGEIIIVCDTSGRIIRFRNNISKLFGDNPTFKIFENIIDLHFLAGKDAGKSIFPVSLALKGSVISRVETTFELKNRQKLYLLLNSVSLKNTSGDIIGCVIALIDITKRKQEEHKMLRYNCILDGINRIFSIVVQEKTEEELGNECLSVALEVTDSQLGFVNLVGDDGLLHDIAISNMGWEQCLMHDETGHRRSPGDFVVHGLYGSVINNEKGFFTNELQSHPDRLGIPSDHPQITSFLGVPLVLDDKIKGLIAVANREGGYSHEQQADLEAIAPAIMQALQRKKGEMEREKIHILKTDLDALTRIHKLSKKLLGTAGTQPLLDEIMYSAVVIVGAQLGTLQLLEDDSLRIASHYGHKQPFLEFFASAENVASVCWEAMQRWERVIVEDVETSPLFVETSSLYVMRKAGVRAVQSTPMINRTGELLDILTTQLDVPYSPDDHDIWRIDLLARQAADLIEQAKMDKEFKESEERLSLLSLLSENLPESALYQYVHELDGSVRFLYCSTGIEKLNSVSVKDVLHDSGTLLRQLLPKYFEQLVENESKSARELSDFDMDVPMRLPDGRTIWDGVQIDITEKKKIESALR